MVERHEALLELRVEAVFEDVANGLELTLVGVDAMALTEDHFILA